MPVHGTSRTTGSKACLLVCSVVGKSLIFKPSDAGAAADVAAAAACEPGRRAATNKDN